MKFLNTKPRVELTGKLGYSSNKDAQRNISRLGFVMPVFQKMDEYLIYYTAIGLMDTAKHLEGNIGIGHRYFLNPNWIIGEYGFYDVRKTAKNNILQQVTLGIEALSKNLEIRANVYIPTTKKYLLADYNIYEVSYEQQINTTHVGIRNKQILERAIPGFDLEVGGSISKIPRLEMFLAYYHFQGEKVDSVIGGRLRSKIRVWDWLSIEGETNYDTKRKFVSYLGLNLGWDIGSSKGNKASWRSRKMTQLPVRDIDIIHGESEKETNIAKKDIMGKAGIVFQDIDLTKDKIITDGEVVIAQTLNELESIASSIGEQLDDIAIVSNKGHTLETKKEMSKKEITSLKQQLLDAADEIDSLLSELSELSELPEDNIDQEEKIKEIEKQQTVASTEEVNDLQQEVRDLQQEVSKQKTVISQLKSRTKSTRKPSKKHRHVLTPRERAEKALKDRARLEVLKTKSTPLTMKERIELTNLKQKVGVSVKSNVKSTYSSAGIKSSASVSALKSLRANLSAQNTAKSSAIASGVTGRPSLKDLKLKKKQRARSSMSVSAASARQKNYPWEFPKKSPFGVKPVTKISIRAGLAKKGIEVRQDGSIDAEIKFYRDYLDDPLRPTDRKFLIPATELLQDALVRKYQ